MDYEKSFLYRLIQFLYVSAFIIGLLLVVYIGYQEKPHKVVNNEKSLIKCNNGRNFTFSSINIFVFDKNSSLSNYEDVAARKACEYGIKDDYSNSYKTPAVNYQAIATSEIQGSWGDVIAWWFGGLVIIFFGINIIRESLLYIFLGKKFSWDWINKVNKLLS